MPERDTGVLFGYALQGHPKCKGGGTMDLSQHVSIAEGVSMPPLGLGTYRATEAEAEAAVAYALGAGYRCVDTASMYGNEEGVGRALARAGIARREVFIATKVWNDEQGLEPTLEAIEGSLARLGLDHVDLYLVHWPIKRHLRATWHAMEELFRLGKARAIGVCNFLSHHLDELLAFAEVPPAVDQVEFHPWLQQPGLQRYLAESGIALQAWAPIIRGRVAEVPELLRIGGRHGKSPSQVTLRWILQLGHAAIPKSVHQERIHANADIFDFELSDADMAAMAALNRGQRIGPHPDGFAWGD